MRRDIFQIKFIIVILVNLVVGAVFGGYVFSDSQKRSFLAVHQCEKCMSLSDLLGLLASVGIQKFPGLLPSVVLETDKSIVVRHPLPQAPLHYVVLPKKDIKHFSAITDDDLPYMQDMIAAMGEIIRKEKLQSYKIVVNGPGIQQVTYMHFHILGY